MDAASISRRAALTGAGAVALTTLGPAAHAAPRRAGAPAAAGAALPNGITAAPGSPPDLAPGERAVHVEPLAMTATMNGPNARNTPVWTCESSLNSETYADGAYPSDDDAMLWASVNVPVGAYLTGVDCTVTGTPRTGTCWFTIVMRDFATGAATLGGRQSFSTGSGRDTKTVVLNRPFTGTGTLGVYLYGLHSTQVLTGLRVRYLPATAGLVAMPTQRIYDSGSAKVGQTPVPVQIAGKLGIPATATAVVVNTEVFTPSSAGYLRVTPFDQDAQVAVQEFAAGQTISNLAIVTLNQGKIQAKISAGAARILMDVSGYFTP